MLINSKSIQQKVISEVLSRLSMEERFELCDPDIRTRTSLEDSLKAVKQVICPDPHFITTLTMRRWVYHYLWNGETPHETREREMRSGLNRKESAWTDDITLALSRILDEDPDLYLTEIQEELLAKTERSFGIATIQRRLKDMGYSLKVAYEKAIQRDEIERASWDSFLVQLGPGIANQMIFVDETHKKIRDFRRRRHWVLRGLAQPFYVAPFLGESRVRYSLIFFAI